MAVVENAGISVDTSNRTDVDPSKSNHVGTRSNDQNFHMINGGGNHKAQMSLVQHGINGNGVQNYRTVRNGDDDGSGGEGFKREMRDLEEMLSKLNPMAEEFVPPSLANNHILVPRQLGYMDNFVMQINSAIANGNTARRVTEEQLAALFINCGQVVDCRVSGDPNSVLWFAFIEFTDEEGARIALSLAGTMLGYYLVRVLPSKTAIAPVNPTFLPQSEDEWEMCTTTIYCTNIDKKVTQADAKLFFESFCGEVYRLR